MKTNSKRIISKSKFICGDGCPYATFNSLTCAQNASMPDLDYILDNGKAVGEFARELFPEAVTVERTTRHHQAYETRKLIAAKTNVICEASFFKGDLFCAVDILKVTKPGHVEIMEVKSATKIKDIFYRDIAFQVYVITKCGYTVDAAYLIYVNNEYVREDSLDPKQYFIVTDVSEDAFSLLNSVESELSVVREALASSGEVKPYISEWCFKPYSCPFWENICKPTLPENSIFDIKGGMRISTKLKLFYDGTRTMKDFLKLKKKQNPKYVQQCRLEVKKDNSIEVKHAELKSFLGKISYPIISLDFETLIEAMQLFRGQKAYDQTVFQFSMHVLHKRGESLGHFEYLAEPKIDWRVALSHELVKCCPSKGTVLVWNEAMEKNRILEFAELEGNEDIKDDLISIASRILDLMVPFRQRVVYNRLMQGSYSLKKVLPALCPDDENLSYADLSINNGMLASKAFSNLVHNKDLSPFESVAIKHALLTYCELDTYGPFCILNEMYKLVDPYIPELFKKTERLDNTRRAIHLGDRVSTNVGNGYVVDFTPCFVRVRLDAGYRVIRMAHNLYNITGLDFPKVRKQYIPSVYGAVYKFYDVTRREVKLGDFVVTNSMLGQVIGRTPYFLKIRLADGKEVLRFSTFVIVR